MWMVVHKDEGQLCFSTGVKTVRKRHLRESHLKMISSLVFDTREVLAEFLAAKPTSGVRTLQEFTRMVRQHEYQVLATTADELLQLYARFRVGVRSPNLTTVQWMKSFDTYPVSIRRIVHPVFEPCFYIPKIQELMNSTEGMRFVFNRALASASDQVALLDPERLMASDPVHTTAHWKNHSVLLDWDNGMNCLVYSPAIGEVLHCVSSGMNDSPTWMCRAGIDSQWWNVDLEVFIVERDTETRHISAKHRMPKVSTVGVVKNSQMTVPVDILAAAGH